MSLEESCEKCKHGRKEIKEITRIRCHRVLHSHPHNSYSTGYYPIVQTIEKNGHGWSCGTCSYYDAEVS